MARPGRTTARPGRTTARRTRNFAGNQTLDLGETCDPCEDTECPSMGCTLFVQQGSVDTCDIACVPNGERTACANDDGCCPAGCTEANDSDCSDECGNGVLDPGELCDGDCESECPSSPCEPVKLEGDPSTCDAQCVEQPIPDFCCAETCTGEQTCVMGECRDPGEDCRTDSAYCFATYGAGYICDPASGICVPPPDDTTCGTNQDCLPWEYCGPQGICATQPDCYSAGMDANNHDEWCAHETWGSQMRTMCDPNSGCVPGGSNPLCIPNDGSNSCKPWEACITGECEIPNNCSDAQDGDLWCVFETERKSATCVNGICSF